LWDALQYLKERLVKDLVSPTRYWIDAICINQADIPERTRQLRIMPYVYERASITLVWLIPKRSNQPLHLSSPASRLSSSSTDTASSILQQPGTDAVFSDLVVVSRVNLEQRGREYAQAWVKCDLALQKYGKPRTVASDSVETKPYHSRYYLTQAEMRVHNSRGPLPGFAEAISKDALRLQEMYDCEYWDRVWIVQEIGKAQRIRVCLGDKRELSWEEPSPGAYLFKNAYWKRSDR
jgi:hypothetical protein